ncbi:MAG: superoxide dismutase [Ilumatobacteraceae bacterium]
MTVTPSVPYTLPDLPYDYSALEPHLSARLLELHHSKHHAAYVQGANETIVRLHDAEKWQVPGLEQSLAFHLGGHYLHSLFWECLSPQSADQAIGGDLAAAIDQEFGSFDQFRERFADALTTIQGSGWAVLGWEPLGQRLMIQQVKDHHGAHVVASQPIFVADGWEHAYYLDYQNEKDRWATALFEIADWGAASRRFDAARSVAALT